MARQLGPAVNGIEQRLDLLIAELRGLRADLASARSPRGPQPVDGAPAAPKPAAARRAAKRPKQTELTTEGS